MKKVGGSGGFLGDGLRSPRLLGNAGLLWVGSFFSPAPRVGTYVWFLSSSLPRPAGTVGRWTDDDVWNSDAVWYGG